MTQHEINRTFDINFAELYDVRPGENDFSCAIKRALNENVKVKHLNNNFINAYKHLRQKNSEHICNGVVEQIGMSNIDIS